MQISLGFLLGGAVGNSMDRIFNENGEVVDYLQFAFWTAWPTFNIADISVCIGAGMLIVYLFQNRNQNQGTWHNYVHSIYSLNRIRPVDTQHYPAFMEKIRV